MAGGFGGDLDNAGVIEGATDGQGIGNVNDRLKVDFSASPSGSEAIIPADETNYFFNYLENGGSRDLNVNGSSTSVAFTDGPTGSEMWFITELVIVLQDGGNLDVSDYGALNSLTNGVLFDQTRDSVAYQIANIQTNHELAMMFSGKSLEGSSQGFLNDANIFIGTFRIEPEITLLGSTSDVLRVTVRDNLTGLSLHQVGYRAWRII